MTQEEAKEVFKNYYSYINRPGAEILLVYLENKGFFESPASTKYHGAEPGGLVKHSINVFRRLLQLAEQEDRNDEYNLETVAVCGLLHDVCKAGVYHKTDNGYEYKDNFPIGHGEKSVIMILEKMELTNEEILAISWHMGAYDYRARGGSRDLNNAFKQSKLAVMLHLADMMATHFDEREGMSGEQKKK